jgi:RHS repeat-associated protein
MATIGLMKIATTGSGHVCPGPTPAMSLVPPTPPAGPVPAPFAYIAYSKSAQQTADRLKIGGDKALVNGSAMDIEQPGNAPSNPTGGDVVTHVVSQKCGVFTGSSKVKAGGKEVACTGDSCRLNMPLANGMVSQAIGKLIMFDDPRIASNPNAVAAGDMAILDPISVASGAVIERAVDVAIAGFIQVVLERSYSSTRAKEQSPFGRGGWSHSLHQFVDANDNELTLRDATGKSIVFRDVDPRVGAFHRASRNVIARDGHGTVSVYSLDTRLTRVFRPVHAHARAGSRAWLSEIGDTSGRRVRFEYEALEPGQERLARVIDNVGRVVVFGYDGDGHITAIAVYGARSAQFPDHEPELLHQMTYGYDDMNALTWASDALGNVERYAYDGHRRMTRKTLPNGLSFHYAYDPESGRCVRAWGDGGLHAGDVDYDVEKGVTRVTGNAEPRVFKWRADGAILKDATADGSMSTEYELDADRFVLSGKNGAGLTVEYGYDAHGNQTSFVDPHGNETVYTYVDDLCVRRERGGLATDYAYNARGQLTLVRYSNGGFLQLSYDERGRLSAVHGPDGLRVGYVWDEQDNCVEEIDARGGVQRTRFDGLGRALEITDAMGRKVSRDLDALGRPVRLRNADGGEVELTYDALGRIVRRVDELRRVTTTRWSGIRSAIETNLPDGSAWRVVYDTLERPQRIVNPKGETFDLRFDRAGNTRESKTFDGRITRFSRTRGQLVARVDQADGSFRTYAYGPAGEILSEKTPHGDVTIEPSDDGLTFTLDDPMMKVVVDLRTDVQGRVVREIQNGRVLEFEYDDRNRLVSRRLPTGQVTRYFYDEASRVIALDHDGYRVDFQRDATGLVVRRVYANGVETRIVHDGAGRVARSWTGASTTLADRNYTWNAGALLIQKNDLKGRTSFTYDELGRLADVIGPTGTQSFEHEADGSIRPKAKKWQVGEGGLLTRSDFAAYRYDEASRRVKTMQFTDEDDETTDLLWDCRSRLREVRKPDGTRVLFLYDALGRRVRKEVRPPMTQASAEEEIQIPTPRIVEYLWEGNQILAEMDSERGLRVFVYEPGALTPLLQQQNGEILAVVTDQVGTPTEHIDARGAVVWAAEHDVWGRILREDGDTARRSPFRHLGQYHDEETGLCYVRYRYFDPRAMRWLSPDPLEIGGGLNVFAFNGTPTSHVDPLGLACILIGDPRKDAYIRDFYNNFQNRPGQYVVAVHGASTGVAYQDAAGNWHNYTPQQLSDRISAAGNYTPGDPMFLNSCNTGRTPNGVAQQLSQGFGATVQAPNDVVWGQNVYIAPVNGMGPTDEYLPATPPGATPVTPTPDMSRQGQLNTWTNGQGAPGNSYRPTTYWHP